MALSLHLALQLFRHNLSYHTHTVCECDSPECCSSLVQVQLRVVPLDKAGRQEAWVPEFLFTVEKITGDEVSAETAGLPVCQSGPDWV